MTSTVYGSQATQTPAATQIAADLERRIITGTLQPGTKLPPERAFAKRYQVSRSTLRDALLELENKNLIRRVQGNGTIVLEPPRDEWDLRAMTAKSNPEYVAELRYTIEPTIARLAALRATAADLLQIKEAVAKTETASNQEDATDTDITFHALLAQASHNPIMAAIVTMTAEWTREERVLTHSNDEWQRLSVEEHNAIAEAIGLHDPDRAEETMRNHMVEVRRRIEQSTHQ